MDRVLVYHVTCDARAGIHTTQRNESLNSLIKGGNVFASALMDMSFYQTNCYLVDLQDKCLESALDEITELLRQNRAYCPKIRALIQKTWNILSTSAVEGMDGPWSPPLILKGSTWLLS